MSNFVKSLRLSPLLLRLFASRKRKGKSHLHALFDVAPARRWLRGYQIPAREPPDKKQPIIISKDEAPIISFPMKNPTMGTVNIA